MYDYTDISSFLAEKLRMDETTISPDDSLVDDLGVDGDDFVELIEAFAQRFSVDMSEYRWRFHHEAEGWLTSPMTLLRLNRIAVTPQLLLEAANVGKWPLEYPPHKAPPHRIHLFVLSVGLVLLMIGLFPWAIMQLVAGFGRLLKLVPGW